METNRKYPSTDQSHYGVSAIGASGASWTPKSDKVVSAEMEIASLISLDRSNFISTQAVVDFLLPLLLPPTVT